MPRGVETINTLVVSPEDMVGYTEVKNDSAMVFGTCANSSRKMMLKEEPRTAEPEVADARIF